VGEDQPLGGERGLIKGNVVLVRESLHNKWAMGSNDGVKRKLTHLRQG